MGLMLPGEVADLLNELGYTWPKSDEEKLFEIGQQWISFGSTLDGLSQEVDSAMQPVFAFQGAGVDALRQRWQKSDSSLATLRSDVTGAEIVGGALIVCAAVVLALKINVIVQLAILLCEIIEAIAASEITFGASLLEIPVFKKIADMVINALIDEALGVILG